MCSCDAKTFDFADHLFFVEMPFQHLVMIVKNNRKIILTIYNVLCRNSANFFRKVQDQIEKLP